MIPIGMIALLAVVESHMSPCLFPGKKAESGSESNVYVRTNIPIVTHLRILSIGSQVWSKMQRKDDHGRFITGLR